MSPAKLRCVVVDDDREFLEHIHRWFRSSYPEFEVVAFTGSIDALECLRRERADLILTAYLMAAVDGLQFISIVRGFDVHVPICMMSSVPMKASALARGATEFFPKSELWIRRESFVVKLRADAAPLAA